jgi:hypothetical protein
MSGYWFKLQHRAQPQWGQTGQPPQRRSLSPQSGQCSPVLLVGRMFVPLGGCSELFDGSFDGLLSSLEFMDQFPPFFKVSGFSYPGLDHAKPGCGHDHGGPDFDGGISIPDRDRYLLTNPAKFFLQVLAKHLFSPPFYV